MKEVKLPVLLTSLCELELNNAFYLRLFRKELVPSQMHAAHKLFRKDIEDGIFTSTFLSQNVYDRAQVIARRHTPRLGTRTLDVLHVASALVLGADSFYTFDFIQGKLAKTEGLPVG